MSDREIEKLVKQLAEQIRADKAAGVTRLVPKDQREDAAAIGRWVQQQLDRLKDEK